MENNYYGRPVIFNREMAKKFLEIFEVVNENLKNQKRCNQYDVATEMKRLFVEAKHNKSLSLQDHLVNQETLKKRIKLCGFLDIPYNLWRGFHFYSDQFDQLERYILGASPDAIVQIKKRLKRVLK